MSALCVGFVACNEPKDSEQNEEGTEIQPVSVSEVDAGLSAFLGANNGTIVRSLFDDGKLIAGKDSCVMINSEDELPETDYLGNTIEYPAFDFYTLVLGHYAASTSGNVLMGQRLFVGSEKITMYISVNETMGGITTFPAKTFWGLYPKLPNLPISVVRK